MVSNRGCAHALFTRVPVPGMVKTRLQPILSPEQCAELQEALIFDTISKLAHAGGDLLLFCSDEHRHVAGGRDLYAAFIEKACAVAGGSQAIQVLDQKGEGLGLRMSNALKGVLDAGYGSCLILGSDLPYVTPEHVEKAERLLDDADVVFGPCRDGGYWLVGAKRAFPELFSVSCYGGSTVLAESLAICQQQGRSIAFAEESSDLDTPEYYRLLCECVHSNDPRVGEHTAAFVAKTGMGL